ncbi:MAG TPA: ABC transporter substrate-binding protein [Thermomicrobiales bacterium]|nr:ABC transporter substrate-binding protein [Thermomicrobiales bacterium]
MATNRKPETLLTQIVEMTVNRRGFLKRVAGGVGLMTLPGLLAACGDDDDDDDDDTGGDEPTATTDAGGDEPTEADGDEATEADGGDEATEADGEDEEATEAPADEPTEEEDEGAGGDDAGEGRRGGRLVIANAGQPTSLDIHQPAGGRTPQLIGWHMFETLFTWDAEYALAPQLAASYEANDEATVHTIKIRQGVPFHNGEELVAADVVASLNRWAELSPLGELLYASLEELVEIDDYTIEFRMSSPIGTVPQLLARGGQGAAIYPASVVEASGTDFIGEYIGTGPYQFTEFQADRYTLLTRFEDYVGPEGEPSGYAGKRNAYLDELEFRPVPDEAARVAGFQAGDYHYLEELIADQIDQMRQDENLRVDILPPRSYGYIGLNHAQGLMSDIRIRKAVQACMNIEPQGLASHGEGYFELGPGIMLPVTVWDSDAGSEYYNMNDPELARQLLEEAGYDGTPVRWLTTQDDLGDYNSAEVCRQQLEEAGFNVELIVLDEATLATTRNNKEGWDAWNGAFILRTDPTLLPFLSSCDYSGWWCSPEKEAAFERLLTEIDFDARFEAFEELQRLFYEEVGGIKQQDNYGIMAVRAEVQNFGPDTTLFELEPEFTNCWLEG